MIDDQDSRPTAEALGWALRGAAQASRTGEVVVRSPTAGRIGGRRRLTPEAGLRRFVENAYQLLLGRPADPKGLDHQLRFLEGGGSRADVLDGLAAAPEGDAMRLGSPAGGRPGAVARRLGVSSARQARLESHLVELYGLTAEASEAQADGIAAVTALLHDTADQLREQLAALQQRLAEQDLALRAQAEQVRVQAEWQRVEAELRKAADETVLAAVHETLSRPRALVDNGCVAVVELDGFLVGVPAAEWRLTAFMAARGNPEPGLTRRFHEVCRPGSTVVDVGANVGMYTLHGAAAVGLEGAVHAFEPTPDIADLLTDNVQLNGFRESGVVTVHRSAVADEPGEAALAVYADNNGHNTLYPKAEGDHTVAVAVTTLDEALDGARVDVVKIDVEGAELRVLQGMSRVLAASPAVTVFCELAAEHLVRTGSSAEEFLRRLDDLGWRVQVVEEPTGQPRPLDRGRDLSSPSLNLELRRS